MSATTPNAKSAMVDSRGALFVVELKDHSPKSVQDLLCRLNRSMLFMQVCSTFITEIGTGSISSFPVLMRSENGGSTLGGREPRAARAHCSM
jgi:hypothetical protein